MSNNVKNGVLLVGAGQIAVEYAKVLRALDVPFSVVGRGIESSKHFFEKTSVMPISGGLKNFLECETPYSRRAIVAVNIENLVPCTKQLLVAGFKKILIEKPGALTLGELKELGTLSNKKNAELYISYNRRFFASTIKAQEIIQNDGGITSFSFEFTEWGHIIEKLSTPESVKSKWFIANSSHVADLAFFLGGVPERITCNVSGSVAWHSSAAVFTGCGITKTGALFAYHANWDAPGRWGVEVLTRNYRLIFRPLEQLFIQKRETVSLEAAEIDYSLDLEFKPGFFHQVREFLSHDTRNLQTIEHQIQMLKIYNKIAGYTDH